MSVEKIADVLIILLLAAVLVYLGPEKYLNPEYVQSQLGRIIEYRLSQPVSAALL